MGKIIIRKGLNYFLQTFSSSLDHKYVTGATARCICSSFQQYKLLARDQLTDWWVEVQGPYLLEFPQGTKYVSIIDYNK